MDELKILQEIGFYYFKKNKWDVGKTNKEINGLKIVDVRVEKDTITIELERVGLLIGKGGENFNNLKAYLDKAFNRKLKIDLVENIKLSQLFCYQY